MKYNIYDTVINTYGNRYSILSTENNFITLNDNLYDEIFTIEYKVLLSKLSKEINPYRCRHVQKLNIDIIKDFTIVLSKGLYRCISDSYIDTSTILNFLNTDTNEILKYTWKTFKPKFLFKYGSNIKYSNKLDYYKNIISECHNNQYSINSVYMKNNIEYIELTDIEFHNTFSITIHNLTTNRTSIINPIRLKYEKSLRYFNKLKQDIEFYPNFKLSTNYTISFNHSTKLEILNIKLNKKFYFNSAKMIYRNLDKFSNEEYCPTSKLSINDESTYIDTIRDLLGNEYTIIDIGSNTTVINKIKIHHLKCNNSYITTLKYIKEGKRCLKCYSNGSSIQSYIADKLTKLAYIYLQEHKVLDTLYRFDFYIESLNLLIEFDGKQHFHHSNSIYTVENFNKIKERDHLKNTLILNSSYKLLRIPYNLSLNKIDNILENLTNLHDIVNIYNLYYIDLHRIYNMDTYYTNRNQNYFNNKI